MLCFLHFHGFSTPEEPSRYHKMRDVPPVSTDYPPATLLRRLGAMFYDSLLLFALLMLASAAALAVTQGNLHMHSPVFRVWLFLVSFLFYAFFWVHGGQTLGMRAWKIRVQRLDDGRPITWLQAFLRFLVAIPSWLLLGLGFLWMLFDKQKLTWHDRFSESAVVRLPW